MDEETDIPDSGSGMEPCDFSEENRHIMRVAMMEGLLGKDAVAEGARLARENEGAPIGRIFLREGMCTLEVFEQIVSRLETKILFCPSCRSFQSFPIPLTGPTCPTCGGEMAFFESREPERGMEDPHATEAPVESLPPGTRYRLGNQIGSGGLGRVIAAKDEILGREVAIKEMMTGRDSPDLLRRFLREGQVAGRLMHPNIVPVYDVGVREEEGTKTPYFAMGRIDGVDLNELLKAIAEGEGKAVQDFSRPRLLHIFQDVCLAVAYAHHHGVIHRDLKPANVMVGRFGEVYVLDWGLAKVKGQEDLQDLIPLPDSPRGKEEVQSSQLTLEGEVLGTPSYMPPEQAAGKISEIDEKSDIYSLGAILYQILTFRPPFEGKTPEDVLSRVVIEDLTPPSSRASRIEEGGTETRKGPLAIHGNIPPELEAIVLKAMAKEKK
ncbi:MAG: serine/threonine-protein kinase, partial [Planctomycetota bacterium]